MRLSSLIFAVAFLTIILVVIMKKENVMTQQPIYGVKYPFSLPELKFSYQDLEPNIDAQTLEIHYTKHHQGYVDKLNKALANHQKYHGYTIEELLTNLDSLPEEIQDSVRNNGGGHFAHMLFWDSMSPNSQEPNKNILVAINKTFGSLEDFKEEFEKVASTHFASGWVWLCVNPEKELAIISTPNHYTPLEEGFYPILVLDVWEHAYYLKYQNRRVEFIKNWWNIVNWNNVERLYNSSCS